MATTEKNKDATTRPAHTLGPWTIGTGSNPREPENHAIVGQGLIVARVELSQPTHNAFQSQANARLIAAAPDMLAALKAAKAIKEGTALKSTSFKLEALIEIGKLLDAAIAKAGGQ